MHLYNFIGNVMIIQSRTDLSTKRAGFKLVQLDKASLVSKEGPFVRHACRHLEVQKEELDIPPLKNNFINLNFKKSTSSIF